MHNHPSCDVRKVKFFGIVSAQEVFGVVEMTVQKGFKLLQQLPFVIPKKRFDPKRTLFPQGGKLTYWNANNFTEFGPNPRLLVEFFGSDLRLT